MADFFDQLMADTEQQRQSLLQIPVILQGSQGNISLNTYVSFLTEAYHHVKHTVPLLMTCGGRLPERLEWLREAVGEYIAEETGHQEWILNDITACGFDAEHVRHGQASLATELMVAYAYDSVQRNNPVSFFGMVLVLEGTSIKLATHAAKAIQQSLNLPDQAFSYLSSHGSLDLEHMDFYKNLMNRLEDDSDKQAVTHAAEVFYTLYGNIFRTLPYDEQQHSYALEV